MSSHSGAIMSFFCLLICRQECAVVFNTQYKSFWSLVWFQNYITTQIHLFSKGIKTDSWQFMHRQSQQFDPWSLSHKVCDRKCARDHVYEDEDLDQDAVIVLFTPVQMWRLKMSRSGLLVASFWLWLFFLSAVFLTWRSGKPQNYLQFPFHYSLDADAAAININEVLSFSSGLTLGKNHALIYSLKVF